MRDVREFIGRICELGKGNEMIALRCLKKATADENMRVSWARYEERLIEFLEQISELPNDYENVKEILSEAVEAGDLYGGLVAGAAAGAYAGPIGAVMGTKYAKDLAGQIKLMEELAKKLAGREYMEAPDRKASKLTFPCCESGERHPGINSG